MICTYVYASSTPTLSVTSLDILTAFHYSPASCPSSPIHFSSPLAYLHPNSPIPSPLSSPLSSPPTVLSPLTYLIPALIQAHLSDPHSHPHLLSHPHSPISSLPISTLIPTCCLIFPIQFVDQACGCVTGTKFDK